MPKIAEFTDARVRRLKLPPERRQIDFFETLFEGRSLVLTVNQGDGRTWSALFYDKGKPKRKKLGDYPKMSVREARKAAREFDAPQALADAKAGSVREVGERFLARYVKEKGLRTAPAIKRKLETYVYPKWGDRPFAEIRRGDVNALLDDIVDTKSADVADGVLAVLRRIMNWHASRHEGYVSPIVPGMRRSNPSERVRQRWLSDEEIRAVWNAVDGTFGAMVKLALLTGQRRDKITTLKWVDLVELGQGKRKFVEWRIDREAREKGTPLALRLPDLAVEVIKGQARIAHNPYVFSGMGKKGHFSGYSKSKRKLDMKVGDQVAPWRFHDLRRTTRKLLTRSKAPVDVGELTLGHTLKGMQATYDDVAEYVPAIGDALTRVAAEIERILRPGKKILRFPA